MKVSFNTITTGPATIKSAIFSDNYIGTVQVEGRSKSFLKLPKGDLGELIKALEGKPTDNQKTNEVLSRLAIDRSTPGEVHMYTGKYRQVKIGMSTFLTALKQLK